MNPRCQAISVRATRDETRVGGAENAHARSWMREEKRNWLPDMDLNHDKQIQSLLCYRYTIGQFVAGAKLELSLEESSR